VDAYLAATNAKSEPDRQEQLALHARQVRDHIKTLSRREDVTIFMLVLGGFNALLHSYSGSTDIVVGTDVANRNRIETENLIGFFANQLVLRTDLSGDPSFSEILARVREVHDVTTRPHIEREMALITVEASAGAARQEVLSLVSVFRAKVVDISHTQLIVEASGNKEKVDTFIELLRPIGITDITRTGHIAINRLAAGDERNEDEYLVRQGYESPTLAGEADRDHWLRQSGFRAGE